MPKTEIMAGEIRWIRPSISPDKWVLAKARMARAGWNNDEPEIIWASPGGKSSYEAVEIGRLVPQPGPVPTDGREETQQIARRLRDSLARPKTWRERLAGLASYLAEGLTCFTRQDERDFVELIRRATAGECDDA